MDPFPREAPGTTLRDVRSIHTGSVLLLLLAGCGGGTNGAESNPTPTPSATATSSPTPAPTPVASECIPEPGAGDHVYECDGLSYDVRVPAACVTPGCGLILDVHGLSMSGAMEDANTKMRERGAANGFIVVQPNATPDPPLSGWEAVPDYAKVYAFLELALTTWSVDADRVHMTGFSQGGLMTFSFLCDHADVFASVAPAAAVGGGCPFTGADVPSREIPILQMHGTDDALVAFSQATSQREAIRAAWNTGAGTVIDSGTGFSRTRYVSAAGTHFEFVQHDYAAASATLRGHCYPGSDDLNGGAPGQLFGFACVPPNGFDWGEEVMAFFLAHPRGTP